MTSQASINSNPLAGFMRQPKIYIRLPSGGEFWEKGSLELTETGEFPVYSMTAKDEMMLKLPDALISGQAVVDVVQHCIPNIKNAWSMPNIDLDVVLIAIRIATYGEKMKVPVTIGDTEHEYEIDLRFILSTLMEQITWDVNVQAAPDLLVSVKPINYKLLSASAVKTFETQRIMQVASDSTMSDQDKNKAFKTAVDSLNEVTIGLVTNSIYKIETSAGIVEDMKVIKDFINNVDKDIFENIKDHIEQMRINNSIKPLVIQPTEEMIANGVENTPIEVPLVFDPTTFFA